jgi:ABC-type branched-subunit amino acid transport system substrate-binding protein
MSRGELARSRARVRARALTLGVGAAALMGTAGCQAAGTPAVKATGTGLTIYTSAPAAGAADPVVRDVLDAEQLAFTKRAGEVTTFKLSLRRLQSAKLSADARTAIQDTSAIAYLGEIIPGTSADTLGITNAEDLLQVSPTDTAVELTQQSAAVSGSPSRYYESLKTYNRTFARVVPTTAAEAHAQITEMAALKVQKLYVTDDGSHYGRALAAAVKADAVAGHLTVTADTPSAAKFSASGADALFFASALPSVAQSLFTTVAAGRPGVKLFAPSSLADPKFAATLGGGKLNLYVSSPGFTLRALPAAARDFLRAFEATYHRAALPQAIFGYEAMAAVIDVLKQAGASANDRSTVVKGFFAIKDRASSVLGPYSINANGDTSLSSFVFERLRAGKLVPFAQVPG